MSLPAAGWANNDYRSRTNNCKKRSILHAVGGQVERGLAVKIIRFQNHIVPETIPSSEETYSIFAHTGIRWIRASTPIVWNTVILKREKLSIIGNADSRSLAKEEEGFVINQLPIEGLIKPIFLIKVLPILD